MFAGEAFAFEQDYVEAMSGEQGGGGAASWTSAYDYDVGVFGWSDVRVSVCILISSSIPRVYRNVLGAANFWIPVFTGMTVILC